MRHTGSVSKRARRWAAFPIGVILVVGLLLTSCSFNTGSISDFHKLKVDDCIQGNPQIENGWKRIDCSAKDTSRNDQLVVTFTGTEAEARAAGVGSLLRGMYDCPLPIQDKDFVVCFSLLR